MARKGTSLTAKADKPADPEKRSLFFRRVQPMSALGHKQTFKHPALDANQGQAS
jgi:hypothetical protein